LVNDTHTKTLLLTAHYDDWEVLFNWLQETDKVLHEAKIETKVIVIDDGSTNFLEEKDFAKLEFTAIDEIQVITLARNMGNQRALAIGIGYVADNLACDYLIVSDCDFEDQPKYIPALIKRAADLKNNVVFAARSKRSEGIIFKIFYQFYKRLYKVLTGLPISIGNFSVIPGPLVRRVAGIAEIASHFPAGIMLAKVPYETINSDRGTRTHGKSKMNIVNLVIHGISGLTVYADVISARIIIGVMLLSISISISILVLVIQRLFTNMHMIGWTSQFTTILGGVVYEGILSAMLMIFLVLSYKNHRAIIPFIDYSKFIMANQNFFYERGHCKKNNSENLQES